MNGCTGGMGRVLLGGVLTLLFAIPALAGDGTTFVDVAADAGIVYRHHTPNVQGFCVLPQNRFCEPERMAGAGAVADYNRDGWPDLYVTRVEDPDILYRNNGDGTFTDVTESAGLTENLRSNVAWWADLDRDGHLDLLVTMIGELRNYCYMNRGDGTFYEDAVARGLDLEDGKFHISWTPAVGDYDNDGYLDVFTVEWGIGFFVGAGFDPRVRLLRNRGAEAPGYFEDVTEAAGTFLHTRPPELSYSVFGFAPAFVDIDEDGHLDLPVAADFGTSTLLWNNGDGTFTDGTMAANTGSDENGMGSTFGDYDGDGDLDWFVTSIFDPEETCEETACNWGYTGNRLYRYEGNRTFSDVTDAVGVREGGWGWGTAFWDWDNDADLDLVMTNGADFPGSLQSLAQFIFDPMVSWTNDGSGLMVNESELVGLTDTGSGKGLLHWDFDRDGDLDLYIVINAGMPLLYRNDQALGNHWFQLAFEGPDHCVYEGLNARVELTAGGKTQVREMGVATHYLGQSERMLHFGLGAAEMVDSLEITWRVTGETQVFTDLAGDQRLVLPAPEALTAVLDRSHDADTNDNSQIDFPELLRVIQLYNAGAYHTDAGSEDGFAPGPGELTGPRHTNDHRFPNGVIELTELLRTIQLFNSGPYVRDCDGEDGFVVVGA